MMQNTHRLNDIWRVECNVLHAWSSIVIYIFLRQGEILSTWVTEGKSLHHVIHWVNQSHLDLWYSFPRCWLVNGHLDSLLIVCHHNGPEGAVVCVDLLIIYWPEPVKQQTLLIPAMWRSQTLKMATYVKKKGFNQNLKWSFSFQDAVCCTGLWKSFMPLWRPCDIVYSSFNPHVLPVCLLSAYVHLPVRNGHHFIIWLVSHNVIDEVQSHCWTTWEKNYKKLQQRLRDQ